MKRTLAIGLVGAGVLLFLSAIGLLPHPVGFYVGRYWPVLLVFVGIEWQWQRLRRGKTAFFAPLVLLLLGLFLLFRNLHIFGFTIVDPASLLIAVVLIYIGLTLFGSAFRVRFFPGVTGKWSYNHKNLWKNQIKDAYTTFDIGDFVKQSAGQKPRRHNSFPRLGEVRYGDEPWSLEPLAIDTLAGSVRINLGTATIPEGETLITVACLAGEVRIQVPESLSVDVQVEVFSGEVRLFQKRQSGISMPQLQYQDADYEEALRKVRIRIKLRFGEVRITRVM